MLSRTKLVGNIIRKSAAPAGKPRNLIPYITFYCGGKCPMCFVNGLNSGVQLSMEKIEEMSRFFPRSDAR